MKNLKAVMLNKFFLIAAILGFSTFAYGQASEFLMGSSISIQATTGTVQISTESAQPIHIKSDINGTPGGITVAANGDISLGDSLTLTDGTETLVLDFNSTIPRIITSDAIMQLGTADTRMLQLGSTYVGPKTDGATDLGTTGLGFGGLYLDELTDSTRGTCDGTKIRKLVYNSDDGTLNLCDGTNWIILGTKANT